MHTSTYDLLTHQVEEIIKKEQEQPFCVAVLGQTGTGKSSFINALFGTALPTDAARPCTREVHRVQVNSSTGGHVLFIDVPGLGEKGKDEEYLALYRAALMEADCVFWTIQGESRSLSYELWAWQKLLAGFSEQEQAHVLGKMTLILTKVDLLSPPPWWLVTDGTDHAFFAPCEGTTQLLAARADYVWDILFAPYRHLIVSHIPWERPFSLPCPGFAFDGHTISSTGLLTKDQCTAYTQAFPDYARLFEHLHRPVIACSARFRYNLQEIMLTVIERAEGWFRLKPFVQQQNFQSVPLSEARQMRNITVYDISHLRQ